MTAGRVDEAADEGDGLMDRLTGPALKLAAVGAVATWETGKPWPGQQ
jgi:hypothetical protein